MATLSRILRRLDVPYHDAADVHKVDYRGAIDVRSTSQVHNSHSSENTGVSIRKVTSEVSRSPQSSEQFDWSRIYTEISIMKHPALKDHPNVQELLGITLIPPFGDPTEYQLGLITHAIHGTLEDLLSVETKSSRDPRPYLISWSEKEDIAIQCAKGLAALHDCHILHNNVQPSSIAVSITELSKTARKISIQVSCFGNAVAVTRLVTTEDIPCGNGLWSSIGPLARCSTSPYCRDIHAYGLMVMHLCFYEFMDIEGAMSFLDIQRGFYDELGTHPGLDDEMGLHHVVSKCCISHDPNFGSLHWVAPYISKYYSIILLN
jgi:hypothetical protein